MFWGCETLSSIRDISNINNSDNNNSLTYDDIKEEVNSSFENNQNDVLINQNKENNLYKGCKDKQIISSISTITYKFTTNNFLTNDINYKDNILISSQCYIFNNISDMKCMFRGCESLKIK